jgi:hypothetical protein
MDWNHLNFIAMKSIHILIILIAAIISIASANGVAEEQNKDRTGSPDGSNTCTTCHSGGGFNPQLSIEVENILGDEVSSYVPGETYTVKFLVSSIPFPSAYGFQATALFSDLSNAGQFSEPGFGVQIEEVNTPAIPSRHIVEHSAPGFVGNFQVQWTAPMTEEPITFYAAAVTANGNNEPEGDRATNTSIVLPAADPDGLAESVLNQFRIITGQEHWIIEHPLGLQADEIRVFNSTGATIKNIENSHVIRRSELGHGLNFIQLRVLNKVITLKVLNI